MKALLRKAERHADQDGALDTVILQRILQDDEPGSGHLKETLRERDERLKSELERAAEAERRLLDAQAKLNALILEKQTAALSAAQAREEATLYRLRLEAAKLEMERANEIMKNLAAENDEINQEAAKTRTENRKLKLDAELARARAEGLAEGRKLGRQEGRRRGREEVYGEGYEEGQVQPLDDYNDPIRGNNAVQSDQRPVMDSSPDTMDAPVVSSYRNVPAREEAMEVPGTEQYAHYRQPSIQSSRHGRDTSGSQDIRTQDIRMPEPDPFSHPESSRTEAARREAARQEAERLEAERQEAERQEMEQRELEQQELEEQREAERADALEAERVERARRARLEATRQDALVRERARIEAEEREEAERLEAARREGERLAREEAARREQQRRAEREAAARKEQERQERRLTAQKAQAMAAQSAASPRPHQSVPDGWIPVMDAAGRIDMPAPHGMTPQPSPRPIESALTGNSYVTEREEKPSYVYPKTPKSNHHSIRSRGEAENGRRSPAPSTPLSQFSLLGERDPYPAPQPFVPPVDFTEIPQQLSYRARNNSQLSVIQEQSDFEGQSPVNRMHSMSPSQGARGRYEVAPSSNPSYVAAPVAFIPVSDIRTLFATKSSPSAVSAGSAYA